MLVIYPQTPLRISPAGYLAFYTATRAIEFGLSYGFFFVIEGYFFVEGPLKAYFIQFTPDFSERIKSTGASSTVNSRKSQNSGERSIYDVPQESSDKGETTGGAGISTGVSTGVSD